jgi:hypothetical protein
MRLSRNLQAICRFAGFDHFVRFIFRNLSEQTPEPNMGRIFLDHCGGSRLFSCANCDTVLTNRSELMSTRFTGATGRAFLFNRAVNLVHSDVQERV